MPHSPDTPPGKFPGSTVTPIRGERPTSTGPVRQRSLPVWLPWLGAPAFLLLPMAGCGLADSLRKPPPLGTAASAALTDTQPHQVASRQPLAMTVVPVVPVGTARR